MFIAARTPPLRLKCRYLHQARCIFAILVFFRSWCPGVSPGGGLGGSAPEAKLRAAGEASAILAFSCAKMTLNVHNFANEGPTSEVNPWEVNMMRGGVPMYQCATDDHTKGILQRLDQSNVAAIDLSAYDVPLQCSGSRWRIKIQRSDLPESDWNERSDMKTVSDWTSPQQMQTPRSADGHT
jgi:hypothetical protein